MKTLYVLCGISGIGKSFYAQWIANNEKKIVSSDAIREEIYGSEECQKNPNLIFKIMKLRADRYLQEGYDVIYDATNIESKYRKELIKEFDSPSIMLVCIDFGNNVTRAMNQNRQRDRHVPEKVILKQSEKYEEPTYKEGWDLIISFKEGD